MILAVLVVTVAFGTESKFQMLTVLLGSAADRTLMLCNMIYLALVNGTFICLLSPDLMRAVLIYLLGR